jgi:hypothetical protein
MAALSYFEWTKSPRRMGTAILMNMVKIKSPEAHIPREMAISLIFGRYS